MRKFLVLAVINTFVCLAQSQPQSQTPDITGVWKADLQRSKIPGPPLTDYLVIFKQKTVVVNRRTGEQAPEMDETTGTWAKFGERRSLITFLINGQPSIRPYEGVPTRVTGSWQGDTLNFSGEVAGRSVFIGRTYEVSPDGQTLTIHSLATADGKQHASTVVLLKQPESAGEPLRTPEETAEKHFKNVKTPLKTLPASEFIDNMRYFAWALNKDCEFCHVKDHFDSDDKKEKKTARKMIEMTAAIDTNNFEGHPEVRCFTCHEGHSHPQSRPPFADEAVHAESPTGAHGQPPPPQAPPQPPGERLPGGQAPGTPPPQ